MEKIDILGVRVSKASRSDALEKIKEFAASAGQHYVVTPNPEIILEAQRDEEFFYILNKADLSLADGFGLKALCWLEGVNIPRASGADLIEDILAWAEKDGMKIGLLFWNKGLSTEKEIARALKEKYPSLKFCTQGIARDKEAAIAQNFLDFAPQIIFVGLGAPWQEKFIYHNLHKIPSAKIALGIGGALDFITEKVKRAPAIFRSLGLEWLWRLFASLKGGKENFKFQRLKRIWRAVIIFPLRFLNKKFICPFFYRPNVSCFLYRKEGDRYKVLLVERQDEPGHWQLPQGGTERETLLEAGERELREEINCNRFIPKRVYKDVYCYKFGHRPGETSEKASSCRKHTGYKGQRQGLFIAEFTGRDEDIKINFWDHSKWKWVDSEKLVDEVHLIRKRSAQRFLKKFKEFVKQK